VAAPAIRLAHSPFNGICGAAPPRAAASVLAAKLSQVGKQVVILEAGPAHTRADLYSSQL
jgi:hypothetical protein